jgi:hypothetical protein
MRNDCYAHSGQQDKIMETGVILRKRARSKADLAKAESKKRKKAEVDSDSDDVQHTPSKQVSLASSKVWIAQYNKDYPTGRDP